MEVFTIRASSLPELFDCPARWESKHIRNMRIPSSSNSVLGKAVHAATAAYDQSALEGSPISIDDAAGVVADTIKNPDEDVDWGEDRPQEAESIGIALTGLYCAHITPPSKNATGIFIREPFESASAGMSSLQPRTLQQGRG